MGGGACAQGRGTVGHRTGDLPGRAAFDQRRPDALPRQGRTRALAARRSDRSPQAAFDQARRLVRGAPPSLERGARRGGRHELEGGRDLRHSERRPAARSGSDVRRRIQGNAAELAQAARAHANREGLKRMAQMNMVQALNSGMDVMLGRDPSVILMGVNGLRPVAEIQFADYIYPGFDQIVSELARLRYRTAGEFFAPVTIRTPCGGGIRGGQTHSQSPEGIFTHVSGLKVVMPSNPRDAKGLLITSIEDDDPVVFFEPKRLYNGPFDGDPTKPAVPWSAHPKGQVDEGYYTVPLGSADVVRSGSQLTIITYGTMVFVALAAAAALKVDAEIVDLRSLVPLDIDTICSSVRKTGRCVVAHEATRFSGFGAEIVSVIQEECFWDLEAPIQRVTGWDTPYPHAFEWEYFPGQARVASAVKAVMESA